MSERRGSLELGWKSVFGMSLSIILLASFIPPAFALDNFKIFSGDDFVAAPNTAELQLGYFTIEVRFRINDDPKERGYLVSKGSAPNGSLLSDQNYALFITKLKSIGGGFRSTDGSYNYIYSPPVSRGSWHVANLTYDGNILSIAIDGLVVNSRSVSNIVDNTADGDLRIGANANGEPAMFFVGDMDYVKISGAGTLATAYYIDFDESVDPPETSDCSDVPLSELRGAVFLDPILSKRENGGYVISKWEQVNKSISYVSANGLNFIRVPYYWEAYVYNSKEFLDRIQEIAQAADENDVCVVFSNFHWYTTSYWKLDVVGNSDGNGFPSFVVKNFPRKNDYDSTAKPFWNAFLNNNITVNGTKVWDVQSNFIKAVIDRVDHYGSVSGYEILNEPHLFDSTQYDKLGNYHTYMAKKIRSITDKKVFFDRETTRGFPRIANYEWKIVPKAVDNLVYQPHLYTVPTAGSNAEKQLNTFARWSGDWGVEIHIGEWAADTQADTDTFVKALKEREFGWTYYAWRPTIGRGAGNQLYESDSVPPTTYLQYLVNAMQSVY
ncbi:MAG: cellulase family glycosylhydrolase [Nitrososphaera sp.]